MFYYKYLGQYKNSLRSVLNAKEAETVEKNGQKEDNEMLLKKIAIICFILLVVDIPLLFSEGKQEKQTAAWEEPTRPLDSSEREAIEDGRKYSGSTIKVIMSTDAALESTRVLTEQFERWTGITVELNEVGWDVLAQQVPVALGSEQYEFDVMDIWEDLINTYAPSGGLVDIADYMKQEIDDTSPGILLTPSIGDCVYAFPYLASWQIMFYNQDHFKETGYDPEVYPADLAEFKEYLRKLRRDTDNDGVIDKYAYVGDWTVQWGYNIFDQFVKAMGQDKFEIRNGEVKMLYDTPLTIKAAEYMVELYKEKLVDPGVLTETQWDITTLFANGDIAFMQMWEMYAGFMDGEVLEHTGFFPFPGKDKGMSATLPGHEYLGIPSTSPNIEASKAYIKFLCSKTNLKGRCQQEKASPVYVEHYSDPDVAEALPWLDVLNTVRKFEVVLQPPFENNRQMKEFTMKQLHKAMLGEITAAEAMKRAQEEFDGGDYPTIEEVIDKYPDYFVD